MTISNKDRYPGSDFVADDKIKPFAEVDGSTYVLVGYEDGDEDAPLVAKARTENPSEEQLFATPFYELLKFAQGEVRQL